MLTEQKFKELIDQHAEVSECAKLYSLYTKWVKTDSENMKPAQWDSFMDEWDICKPQSKV